MTSHPRRLEERSSRVAGLRHRWAVSRSVAAVFIASIAASSCGETDAEGPVAPPTVRVFEVGKKATGQSRRISGRVEALHQAALSFGVGGKITQVLVVEGQQVAEGQLLAELDSKTLRLKAEESRTQLVQAKAELDEATSVFNTTGDLLAEGGASSQELDTARTKLAAANGAVANAGTAISRAEVDLERTKLFAPFAGTVVAVDPEAFQEVGAVEAIVTIQSEEALKVEVLVPESLIRDVEFGQVVEVAAPTAGEKVFRATISQIGAQASEGNAFPVTAQIAGNPEELRSGMTASVTFNFSAYLDGRVAYLVPLSSLAVDTQSELSPRRDSGAPESGSSETAPLFVFNGQSGTLDLREVTIGGLRGNEVEIFDGLEAGDLVVSAGVAFLRDGMKARVWEPRR